jgi:hypothetical protein
MQILWRLPSFVTFMMGRPQKVRTNCGVCVRASQYPNEPFGNRDIATVIIEQIL